MRPDTRLMGRCAGCWLSGRYRKTFLSDENVSTVTQKSCHTTPGARPTALVSEDGDPAKPPTRPYKTKGYVTYQDKTAAEYSPHMKRRIQHPKYEPIYLPQIRNDPDHPPLLGGINLHFSSVTLKSNNIQTEDPSPYYVKRMIQHNHTSSVTQEKRRLYTQGRNGRIYSSYA